MRTSGVIPQSEIVYQEVNVTALRKDTDKDKGKGKGTKTEPDTVTVTETPSPTPTSNAGAVQTITAGPLAMMGGVIGAGVLAIAAL